jgi:hypothetical protein
VTGDGDIVRWEGWETGAGDAGAGDTGRVLGRLFAEGPPTPTLSRGAADEIAAINAALATSISFVAFMTVSSPFRGQTQGQLFPV